MPEGSIYLQPEEYSTFGLPNTITEALVRQAGGLIDGFLTRPGGLVWSPDATGAPCYMTALRSTTGLRCASPVAPGSNVVVPYVGPVLDNNSVGEVVVLDRANANRTEACIVQAVNTSPKSLVLTTVQFAHDVDSLMEFGLTLMEQKDMPKDRSQTILSEHPIMAVQSGVGRYGYGRRSSQVLGSYQDFNLLATVSNFGGPPLWIPWQVSSASINRRTGEIWVPAGVLLAYYTEVKIWYVAGFQQSQLPWQIKQACANLLLILKETGLGANVRRREQTGGTATSKFENTLVDANTRELLRPFAARNFM